MVTYRCETCGTTETASTEHLDQFWISALPSPRDSPSGASSPLRYCGTGCVPDGASAVSSAVSSGLGASGASGVTPTRLTTIHPLSQWFDAHAASQRFIALLSPT